MTVFQMLILCPLLMHDSNHKKFGGYNLMETTCEHMAWRREYREEWAKFTGCPVDRTATSYKVFEAKYIALNCAENKEAIKITTLQEALCDHYHPIFIDFSTKNERPHDEITQTVHQDLERQVQRLECDKK